VKGRVRRKGIGWRYMYTYMHKKRRRGMVEQGDGGWVKEGDE